MHQIDRVRLHSSPVEGGIGTHVVPEGPIGSRGLEDQRVRGRQARDLPDASTVGANRQEGTGDGRSKLVITQVSDQEHVRPERRQIAPRVGH
jgi:hypothetical protein